MPIRDLTNQTFGRLKAKSLLGRRERHTYWLCECSCGNICTRASTNLVKGATKSCGCLARDSAIKREIARTRTSFKKLRQPIYNMVTDARRRAAKKNLPFDLDWSVIEIPSHCPILGIPLYKGSRILLDNSPTLDRIIPKLGYIKTNVKVISHKANTIKSFGSADEHEAIAKYIRENTSVN